MNLEFLENVSQFLPSLDRCADKRAEADEVLTAALPLSTLAQPDAAETTDPHRSYTHYTQERKQICLCLRTNSHHQPKTLACSIERVVRRHPKSTTSY